MEEIMIKKMVSRQIQLPVELWEAISRLADFQDKSMAQVLREHLNTDAIIQESQPISQVGDYPEVGDKVRNYKAPWTLCIEAFDENKEVAFAIAEDNKDTTVKYKLFLSRLEHIEPHCWNFYGSRPQR